MGDERDVRGMKAAGQCAAAAAAGIPLAEASPTCYPRWAKRVDIRVFIRLGIARRDMTVAQAPASLGDHCW